MDLQLRPSAVPPFVMTFASTCLDVLTSRRGHLPNNRFYRSTTFIFCIHVPSKTVPLCLLKLCRHVTFCFYRNPTNASD